MDTNDTTAFRGHVRGLLKTLESLGKPLGDRPHELLSKLHRYQYDHW